MNTHHQPTHVVTCFVLRRSDDHDEIFVVRRSQHVRTYRGAWAGISGYLESGVTSVQQAYTELKEELGLQQEEVRLLKTGAPFTFTDTDAQQSWTVHPFLFEVPDWRHIRLDWEATESRWITPSDIAVLPTVPHLADALSLVYPLEAGEESVKRIEP